MPTTVLIVEDDFDTLHPLAELLRLKGFEVITASDAEQALGLTGMSRPHLIISDIALPGRSGLHFIQSVREDESTQHTPILVISGCGPMILVEAESAGADCCLDKPIHIGEFWRAVDQLLRGSGATLAADAADARDDEGRSIVGEVDRLVHELRNCGAEDNRDVLIKTLKENILRLQAKNRG